MCLAAASSDRAPLPPAPLAPRAAASPQPGCPKPLRLSTLPAAQKKGLALAPPPPADPASGTPPEAQTLASSSSELGSAPWRSLRPRTPREADAPPPAPVKGELGPRRGSQPEIHPPAPRPTRGVCGEGTGKWGYVPTGLESDSRPLLGILGREGVGIGGIRQGRVGVGTHRPPEIPGWPLPCFPSPTPGPPPRTHTDTHASSHSPLTLFYQVHPASLWWPSAP